MFDHHVSEIDRNAALLDKETSRRLLAYWNRLRGARLAPDRCDIEPADIAPILGDAFILQADDPENLPYRLAGTRLVLAMGRELRGENWLAPWQGEERNALMTLFNCLIEDVVGIALTVRYRTHGARSVRFEWVFFPLAMRHGGIGRIIGVATPMHPVMGLGSDPVVDQDLEDARILWLNRSWHDADHRDARFGLPDLKPTGRVGHLAVYDGGRAD